MNAVAARILAFAGGVVAASTGAAQTALYRDVTATHLPAGLAGPCMDAAAADADGDGDLDIALAMEFQPNVLLLNDGSAAFVDGSDRLPRSVHDSEDVAFADFDNDGDLDLVFVSEDDRTDELYLNDGAGWFADASTRLPTDDVSNALAVLDINGDGAVDLLTGNIGRNRVLINDGRGSFRDETVQRWPQGSESRTQDLELADVDADGDLDVIVGNEGRNQIFSNQNGRLVDATERSLPVRMDETREIRAADIDGDGDLDLVVANVTFGLDESPQDYLLLNDGSGAFTFADRSAFPEDARSNFTVQLVDVDRDGDLDVLAPSTVFPRRAVEFLILVTDARGRAAVARAPGFDAMDVDGDGDLDAVVLDGDRSQTFLSDGGRFIAADDQATWEATLELDEVDIDGDGNLDLAATSVSAGDRLNEGTTTGEAAVPMQRISSSVQIVDLDLDGHVDVIVPSTSTMDGVGDYLVLANDGTGRFSPATAGSVLPAGADGNGFDIEVADFDDDGMVDLFLCNRASISAPESAAASGGRQRLLLGQRSRD